MSIESFLLRCWYQRGTPLWPLAPLEWMWRAVAAQRSRALRREPLAGVPVIVVGNIAVGGTGKTPVVIALAEYLSGEGYRPGVVSRGYGGSEPARPHLVQTSTPASVAGDEAALVARRTGLPVAVCRQRRAAAAFLIEEHACNVIISDDGLQHYALPRIFEIVMIDGQRGLGNGRCLPVGPLRETPGRLGSVDYILVTGEQCDDLALPDNTPAARVTTDALQFVNLIDGRKIAVSQWQQPGEMHAVAGIGNPQRFFATLNALGISCSVHAFADHHEFTAADIHFGDADAVIMTEKDAVKCDEIATDKHWYLQVECPLPQGLLNAVKGAVKGEN